MAQITRSKKFEVMSPKGLRRLACWGLLLCGAPFAMASEEPRLPVLQTVGVIPVQYEGPEPGMATKQALEAGFTKAVRGSRRFHVLGDDLVEGLWNSDKGRDELRDQFELNSYVSLTVTARGDVTALTAHLLDSRLKTELVETDTVGSETLASSDAKGTEDRLEGLVYRLFNRLPVDVSVTSVQGAYITLSGGSEQGIEMGDRVDLVRANIRSTHPANGSWLEFNKKALGTAQVVDIKTFSSVAKLLTLTYENAVEVGDGARISALASRVKFARLAANEGFKDSGEQSTILVPPLYTSPPSTAAPLAKKPPVAGDPPKMAQADQAPIAESPKGAPVNDAPPPVDDKGPSMWEDVASDVTSHRLYDSIEGYAGPYWWNVKGPANASGQFPLYLLNSIGAGVTRTTLYKIKTSFQGGVMFGKTSTGNYTAYDGRARIYWEDALALGDGLVTKWRAGGTARLSGIAVNPGDYGGGDWLRGGAFGGLDGSFHAGENNDRYDWFGELGVVPLNLGRMGYNGSRHQVQSSFGTTFALGAYQYQPARIIQWGGGIEVDDEHQTLNNDRVPHVQEFSLHVLAKYVL